eukprot:PhF_6_TR7946/c1_g1_i1/m.11973
MHVYLPMLCLLFVLFPTPATGQIDADIAVIVTCANGPPAYTADTAEPKIWEVTAEQIWVGGVQVVLKCGTFCQWADSAVYGSKYDSWNDFYDKIDVRLANFGDDNEQYGMKNLEYRKKAFGKKAMSLNATHAVFTLPSLPGFVLQESEALKITRETINDLLGQGSITVNLNYELTLLRIRSDDATYLAYDYVPRFRVSGTPFLTSFFSERDVRLYGLTLNLSLVFDVFRVEDIDFKDTLQVGYTDKSYPDADTATLTTSMFDFKILQQPNLYTLSIRVDPNPTFDLEDSQKKKTRYTFFVRLQQILDRQPTFRGGTVTGRRRNNFTLWTMPNLKCALAVYNGSNVVANNQCTESMIRAGGLVFVLTLTGSDFAYASIGSGLARTVLQWWTCDNIMPKGTALMNSRITVSGNTMRYELIADPNYDINDKDETCNLEIKNPLESIWSTESCKDKMSLTIKIEPGTLVGNATAFEMTEDEVRQGGKNSMTYRITGDKFLADVSSLTTCIVWKSASGVFGKTVDKIIPQSNFNLSSDGTFLQLNFAPSTYEIVAKEIIEVQFPAACFQSGLAPYYNGVSFTVKPVPSILTYNQLTGLTKRNFTTLPCDVLNVYLIGDVWTLGPYLRFEDAITITETPTVDDGFLKARKELMNGAITVDGNVMSIKFQQSRLFLSNKALSITFAFPSTIISSGLRPLNTNNLTLNISEISGTVRIVSNGLKIFREDDVRAGRAEVTLLISDDAFQPKEVINTLYLCENRALCPIPLRQLPSVSDTLIIVADGTKRNPGNNTLIFQLGTLTFDISANTTVLLDVPAQATRSGLKPICNTTIMITVVAGVLNIGFDPVNRTEISEEMIRRGTGPTMYLELLYDLWIRDTARIRSIFVSNADIFTSQWSGGNPNVIQSAKDSFFANADKIISSVAIIDKRLYLYFQAVPDYDIFMNETVTVRVPSSIIISNQAPVQTPKFMIYVSRGYYYISGSFTRGVTSSDIRNPFGPYLELIITLEGERWVTATDLDRKILQTVDVANKDKLFPSTGMSVNENNNVVTFVVSHYQEYRVTSNVTLMTFNVDKGSVLSGFLPILGSTTNVVEILAAGGHLSTNPSTVNVSMVQAGFEMLINIKDGSQFAPPTIKSVNLFPNINSVSSTSEEPRGFAQYKSTLLQGDEKGNFHQVTADNENLRIRFSPQKDFFLFRPETIVFRILSSWLSPPYDCIPPEAYLVIQPDKMVMYAVLQQDNETWGDNVTGELANWTRNLSLALGVRSDRIVVDKSEKFLKFSGFTSTKNKPYTSVQFYFTDSTDATEKSAYDLVTTLLKYNSGFRFNSFRMVALLDYVKMQTKEPDWIMYTPEAPPPPPPPDPPESGMMIYVIAGGAIAIGAGMFVYYKSQREGQGIGGAYRTRKVEDHNAEHEMSLIERKDREDERHALRLINGADIHVGQRNENPSFHNGRHVQRKPSWNERNLPDSTYVGQKKKNNNVNDGGARKIQVEEENMNFRPEQKSYIQQVLDEMGIPPGSIYPDDHQPHFRPPPLMLQEGYDL